MALQRNQLLPFLQWSHILYSIFGVSWLIKHLTLSDTPLGHISHTVHITCTNIILSRLAIGTVIISSWITHHNLDWRSLALVPWLVVIAPCGILFMLINGSITQQNNNDKQFDTCGGVALIKHFTAVPQVCMFIHIQVKSSYNTKTHSPCT